jgi:hypothetical protein
MIVLSSFANTPLKNGFTRLRQEADSFNIFDKIFFYTEKELDKDFQKKFRFLMRPYSRGYGYWCWKPQVIAQTLKLMSEGDILVYMDLGSHLNLSGKSRFMDYIELIKKSTVGVLAFRSPQHLDKRYSKIDVFRYFGVENNDFYINTTQIEATHIFFRKCEESVNLADEWLKALIDDYTIFTDFPSKGTEYHEYERNTGDQSVFSILAKKYNIDTLSTDETWATDWSLLHNYPLLAKRNKTLNHWWQRKYFGILAKYYKLLWGFTYGVRIKNY